MKPADVDDVQLRSLLLLESLAAMEQPAGLAQVMERTGLPKAKAYRALRALQDAGFVDHVSRQGYRIGARGLALSMLIAPRPAFARLARPVLRWLADATQETATLFLRSGAHRILVYGAAPSDPSTHYALPPVGERAPLTKGAAGLAILAHLPDDEVAPIVDAAGRSRPSAPELAAIRADGYAMSFSSNRRGANGVAAPILDPRDRRPLGSISVAGAEPRLPEPVLRAHAAPLRRACTALAPQIGTILGPHAALPVEALDVVIDELTNG